MNTNHARPRQRVSHAARRTIFIVRSGHLLRRLRSKALTLGLLGAPIRTYYGLRFWAPVWRGILNRRARFAHGAGEEHLSATQGTALAGLRTNGLAVLGARDLVGGAVWERACDHATRLLGSADVQSQVAAGRSVGIHGKDFVVRVFGEDAALDLTSPLAQLLLSPSILTIVNAYFGFHARLQSFDVWCNLSVEESPSTTASQRWHRDYEDRQLVKLFVYLRDVGAHQGPFSFIPGTHKLGPWGGVFPSRPPEGAYPPDGAVEDEFGDNLTVRCTGPAGTTILCDTTGLHQGGRVTTGVRELITATYASMAAIDPVPYQLADAAQVTAVPDIARRALPSTRRGHANATRRADDGGSRFHRLTRGHRTESRVRG
jgi:hypothetical protein